ncbi:MAG TPA: MBL fold metallo-hydrolase [Pseudorhodoplanes sp.]|nr:MBL fold metallo-hydrolase [Pseudorhodoplanes sp.]
MNSRLSVRFWGVRGSIACPGPDTVRYGGNTPCIEIRCGDHMVIFDGGTGIRPLGEALVKLGKHIDADIFFSHCHVDHVSGLPFFAPFYSEANSFRLWAGNLLPRYRLKQVMQILMSEPTFPIGIEAFRARMDYRDFSAGDTLEPRPGVSIRTVPLDHPGGATGYRLDFAGRSVAYLTDNEKRASGFSQALLRLAQGADLAIYDCTFTDDEIGDKAGWGHSTWRDGLRLADAAQIKTFCMFHHAPEHDDDFMDGIAREVEALRPGTIVATEGRLIEL